MAGRMSPGVRKKIYAALTIGALGLLLALAIYEFGVAMRAASGLQYRALLKQAIFIALLLGGCAGIWVYSRANSQSMLAEARKNARISSERYRIIASQLGSVLFEVDRASGKIVLSDNFSEVFDSQSVPDVIDEAAIRQIPIHDEDRKDFVDLAISLWRGEMKTGQLEARVSGRNGEFIWVLFRANAIMDADGRLVSILGTITDIDAQKRERLALSHRAMTDPMTGLYNKGAAIDYIDEYLGGEGSRSISAMMLIDLDEFKKINDTFGHLFGDAVLIETAEKLQKLFRSTDFIARVGGDEFIVFLANVPGDDFIERKARQMTGIFRTEYTGGGTKVKISGSVGVAVAPRDGVNYSEMFRKADLALYAAKTGGKDQFRIYASENAERFPAAYGGREADAADARGRATARLGIKDYVFELLYESRDFAGSMNMALSLLGRKFSVSRVYVFEQTDSGHTGCTYEWCAPNIAPCIDRAQNLPAGLYDGYASRFDENGVFYCPDVGKLDPPANEIARGRDVRAILHACLSRGEKVFSFIGFDDCLSVRYWTRGEIDALVFSGRVIETFLELERLRKGAGE